jgi:phosphotransferase system enzyme I (PtsI)
MEKITGGKIVSKGYGIGKILTLMPFNPTIIDTKTSDISGMTKRFEEAVNLSQLELVTLVESMRKIDASRSEIFEAHLEILNDIAINEMIHEHINQGIHPSRAILDSYTMFIDMLSLVDDDLIRERITDIKDVMHRLLRNLEGKKEINLSNLDEDVIIVTKDLLPSETATMDKNRVKGIVAELGSDTSHSAIIARSYNIPAILGIRDLLLKVGQGDAVLDAYEGLLIINPSDDIRASFIKKYNDHLTLLSVEKTYINLDPITLDGKQINLFLNIESNKDDALKQSDYVSGIGLFRSEFLYMKNTHFPTLDEQISAYSVVSRMMKDKKVTIRTLDIGGDKSLTYYALPKEQNPFLGKRALRLCLDELPIFETQLKALLIANTERNIEVMFPMVGSVEDIHKAMAVVNRVKASLDDEGIAYAKNTRFGVMIEIPSIALMSEEVVKLVDFASIGTNDLTQYLMAVDRMDASLSEYYQTYSPALLRLIKLVSDVFNNHNKPLSICGEIGGDILAVPILIGMGVKNLSMSASQIARVKKVIRNNSLTTCTLLAEQALSMSTQQEVIDLVKKYIIF